MGLKVNRTAMIKALPVTEFKPFAHQLQYGIPIPHDLMAGWPIIVSIKIPAQLCHHGDGGAEFLRGW